MPEQMELGDILSNKEPPKTPPAEPVTAPAAPVVAPAETTPAAPEKPETEAEAQARGRDAAGKFVAKDKELPKSPPPAPAPAATPAAPAAPPQMTEKEKALLAAALDERNKRQVLERQLAEARAAKPATPAEPPKQFFDDPEGAMKAFEEKMTGMVVGNRLQTSEMIARSRHADFEEKVRIFSSLVDQTPGLWQQALSSADPAEFAYITAKNHKTLQDAGSIEQLRANIEKETRIKIEEELKKKQEDAIKERASIPPSLSDAHGVTQNRPVWSGPPSLEDILKP